MKKVLRKATIFCALCLPMMLQAAEVNFSGFATIAGGMTLDEKETLGGKKTLLKTIKYSG